jgi:hypothetical protein
MKTKIILALFLFCVFLSSACIISNQICGSGGCLPIYFYDVEPTEQILPEDYLYNTQEFQLLNRDAQPVYYSLSSKQITAPEDVLKEVSWSGGFGGTNTCESLNLKKGELKLLFVDPVEKVEWMKSIPTNSCGWLPGEVVSSSVTSPSGETIMEELVAEENGELYGSGFPNLYNTHPGTYIIEYKGESGILSLTIVVKAPDEPRLYEENDTLLLYNFSPKEKIRLLVYKPDVDHKGTLWDFVEYMTDDIGQLIIITDKKVNESGFGCVVIGEKSGEVHRFPPWTDPLGLSPALKTP